MIEGADDEEKVSILLVDDRPGNLLSLKAILDRDDYDLVLAETGEEALRLALSREFAVILLDVAMPGMDGFEVATTLRRRQRFRSLPIIFVTASVQQIDWIYRAYSLGAVDLLQKPVDPHAVRAKVAVFVELFRQKRQLRSQADLLRDSAQREREHEVTRLTLENERRYRNLADAIPQIVWIADAGGNIEYFNHRWPDATGLDPTDSLGTGWRVALHPEDAADFDARWATALAAGTPFHAECRLAQSEGGWRGYLCRALPEKNAAGEIARWLGTFTDVEEQRRAHEETQAAVRLRDEFLSVASHELRTPLTTLALQLHSLQRKLAKDDLDSGTTEKLGTVMRQVKRLEQLIDSLLDVSRIARGALELHYEEMDLGEVAADVVERFRDEATRVGSELRLRVGGLTTGSWDRLRVEQVITNLVSNALKYGSGRPIDVEVMPTPAGASLVVADHGIGIPEEEQRRIFGRFARAVPSRHYAGLGLGLYIVRQIVEAHGGSIEVSSEPGQGSSFQIVLPFRMGLEASATGPA